jgi:site-specific recombinase XerD
MPLHVKILAMPTALDLAALLPSWLLHLRAERKSAGTLTTYRVGVEQFIRWCAAQGRPAVLDRATVNGWVASMLDAGQAPNTATARLTAVKRFSAWLVDEDEQDRDELLGLRPPKRDVPVTQSLTDDQVAALVRTCNGKDFGSRRDEAIIRLMLECGLRAGELVALEVGDIDLSRGIATVRRGKGGRGRIVPFGPHTARSLDRYMRLRRTHKLADGPALWLGVRNRPFSYDGLYKKLKKRAEAAGIEGFHPHITRHTGAAQWLAAGGSEGGLMAVFGWSQRSMIDRYTAATAAERAVAEARKLNLGAVG